MDRLKKWDKTNVAVGAAFVLFFSFLLIKGEPMYLGDSFQHEYQFVTREPVYALLIQILRFISPEHHYWLVICVQCILAIVANTMFIVFLRKELKLSRLMTVLAVLLILMPHIMTPLASATNMVITNSLLSEGISFSLHLFFMKYIFTVLWRGETSGKNVVLALVWAMIVSLVRGQFMTLFLVWFIVVSLLALCRKQWKRIGIFVLVLATAFLGRELIVKTYNYCEQGLFVSTVSGQAMSVSNVLYVSDRVDGEAIEDEKLRELFYSIYDEMEESGLTYGYSPKGLIARAKHHEECHDTINFEYFSKHAKEYITENQGISVEQYQEMMVAVDQVAAELQKALIIPVLRKYVFNYVAIASMGFIRSIAYVHPMLNYYTVLMYLIAIVLAAILLKRNKNSRAAQSMLLVLLMITGNVMATSLMLQCISRYMIYNFPFFYLAGALMLKELWESQGKRGQ